MLVAEGAEIRKRSEFLEVDRRRNEQVQAEEILKGRPAGLTFDIGLEPVGLIWQIENSHVLEYCLDVLVELRQRVKTDRSNEEEASRTLKFICGDSKNHRSGWNFGDTYIALLRTAKVSEEKSPNERSAIRKELNKNLLQTINFEIDRLTQYRAVRESVKSKRLQVEILRQRVPDFPGLDRLLRYASSLERAFDRTLAQLERVQRIRRGQPVLPPVKLDISS
jgi:hypothetical protein